ncbi:MAG TPA: baseplate J/gp47 family protein [Allosphingosinicella sp.]
MSDFPSTAIDLSRLPPPTVVEQLSFEQIYADGLARLQVLLPGFDATVESDPAVKLLQLFAYRELLIRQQFNDRARGLMVAYAAGADLDQLAALVGVQRFLITPANAQTGAAALYEGDDAFRARVVLAPESFSVAGPDLAYVYHAKSADPDVLDASAISPEPGEVIVSVLSRTGNGAASPALVAKVAAIVNSRTIRPLTDLVTVQSAAIVDFAIAAQLFLFPGPDGSIVTTAAQARLDAYLADARKLGRDIARSAILAALHVEGVQRVELASPPADVGIGPTQAGHCTGVQLSVAGYGS